MNKLFIPVVPSRFALSVCATILIALGQSGCAQMTAKSTEANAEQQRQAITADVNAVATSVSIETQRKLEKDWGIRVVGLRSTMSGMMVDFRYKVTDALKASPLLDINTPAYLLVEKNKARLGVPNSVKIGALRQTINARKVQEGRDYFILFGNPGAKYIKRGDKATLVIGDMKVEHLTLL